MIPKIIHYCWFGGKELPELAQTCIESWKTHLPDYEIRIWNESNFNLDLFPFVRQAYDSKKFAFVTDVVRLFVLKEYGGLYMDTDVEVLKPLDQFLSHSAFSGFENNGMVPTGLMGSQINGKWVTEMLEYYYNRDFLDKKGEPILKTNVIIISKLMRLKGIKLNNTFQEIKDYVAFYPHDFFCPKDHHSGQIILTDNTFCIHHFAGSWTEPLKKDILLKQKLLQKMNKMFGQSIVSWFYTCYCEIFKK